MHTGKRPCDVLQPRAQSAVKAEEEEEEESQDEGADSPSHTVSHSMSANVLFGASKACT